MLEQKKKVNNKITSSITQQIWYKHWITESFVPVTVTARSVELDNRSEDTCILAPVDPRISFILDPPLPIKEPHCDAGIINFITMDVDRWPLFLLWFCISWNWKQYRMHKTFFNASDEINESFTTIWFSECEKKNSWYRVIARQLFQLCFLLKSLRLQSTEYNTFSL